MSKYSIIIATAVLVVVGCTKNAIFDRGYNNSDNELAFQSLIIPSTKSLSSSQHLFDRTSTFNVYAFFLDSKNWDADYANSKIFINNKEVSYDTTMDIWRPEVSYYWPKSGYLTFFAYAPATINATCDKAKGITISDFDIFANYVDFMVADKAKNKNSDEHVFQWSGVPILFRHKLTRIAVTVVEGKDYSNGHDGSTNNEFQDGDKVIKLKSIIISNINTVGNYIQNETPEWNSLSEKKDYTFFTGEQTIGTTKLQVGDSQFALPQTLSSDVNIIVSYDISTFVDDGHEGVREVVEKVNIQKLVSQLTPTWNPGTDIVFNLSFDMSNPALMPGDPGYGEDGLVYWDPAVQDWETNNNDVN